ncbi:hypothetical protein NUW58_g6503 [Xylaria curta]|uniref:Uncharacterized protein n=1 Tax=Xylaria curta TaxID=42375 RepID=A0ACC1NTM9_9PEZI|nr:hypothetical protein NUW58_g6503 [Xylaria curta]
MSGLPSNLDIASVMANSRGTALLAISAITIAIAIVTCVLRCCVQLRINKMIGWEDYSVGGAMLVGIIGVSFAIVEGASQEDIQSARQFNYLAQPWLNISSTLSKVSLCLLLRRLISGAPVWKTLLAAQIVLLLLVNAVCTFTSLLQCRPLEKLWKPDIPGRCWSPDVQQNIGYFQGAFGVVTQLLIALLPLMAIQDLMALGNMRRPVYVLSLLSVTVAMLGVLRTYNISVLQLHNERYFEVIATILSVLEQNLNIISANVLPVSSLCFKKILPTSQVLDDAASAKEIDSRSIVSQRSQGSRAERRRRRDSNVEVGGPQKESFRTTSLVHETVDLDAWPLGIIKTVSVEVVEEDESAVPAPVTEKAAAVEAY